MAQDQISFLSNLTGGCIFLALSLLLIYLWRQRSIPFSLILATVISTVWQLCIAGDQNWWSLPKPALLILEIARDGAWINALLGCMKFIMGRRLPLQANAVLQIGWIAALIAAVILFFTDHPLVENIDTLIWVGLFSAVLGLVAVEQLYRNSQQFRLVKLLSIAIGSIFVYDVYLFSHGVIFHRLDPELWQARGGINGLAALVMALGSLAVANQSHQQARLTISRPVVFYTTSLTASGSFFALMALGGYYVQLYGGSWGTVMQILLLFVALMAIAIVFVSRTARSRLNVWINKHFFHHKYDYRLEWLKLINYLSQPSPEEDFHERAIRAAAAIFKSPGGALWLRQGESCTPVCAVNLQLPESVDEPLGSAFCQELRNDEWVFSPKEPAGHPMAALNTLLPSWMSRIDHLWLVLPLLTETELLGFIVLTEPELDSSLTWEDLDMAKTVGRQLASYLDRHEAAEMLAESRQFDAFNKLTAFIMHDLKNLIAQQALVVENAAKHRDNPEFFEDAIRTIDNSVGRMSNLLKKLQQNEPSELRSLELHRVMMESIKKCKEQRPVPSLRFENTDLRVNADQDRLTMVLAHIIRNAQEATKPHGFVDVTLRRENNNAIITVEDNGGGMNQDFIKNQLFRPFVTTKSGKGMGIGAYQTKEFIASLGGSIAVDSIVDEGTTFTIVLPTTSF
ncbi:MAG: XrtA/PEP-CTERM system histidine kinase PrsK [Spongiibacteraceae bacterium]